MKVFYGSAIQGAPDRGMRVKTNIGIIQTITSLGHTVFAEHTTGRTREEGAALLEAAIGRLPLDPTARKRFIRDKMIEAIEKPDLGAAIFEVSLPSTGTGVEIAHTYMRPRAGLPAVPTLLLYERGYWKNGLSTMVSGLPFAELPNIQLAEYTDNAEAEKLVRTFLSTAVTGGETVAGVS